MTLLEDRTVAPERSLRQRMDALGRANEIRSARAQLKKDLKAGRVSAAAVISEPPEWADTMKLADLLLAVPKIGRVKRNKLLMQCRVSNAKTLGGLTERQREELLLLGGRWLR